MATNELTRKEIIRRFHELTDVAPDDLVTWLRLERKGRDPNARDPGDHEPAERFRQLKHKDMAEIDDADLHSMSTLVNYLDERKRH